MQESKGDDTLRAQLKTCLNQIKENMPECVTWRVPEGDGSTVLPPTAPGNQPARGDDSPVSEEDHE